MTRRVLAGLAVLAVAAFVWGGRREEVVARHRSPDGRFEVEVARRPDRFAAPGDASGAPGTVRLVDLGSGHVLAEAPVEQVQLADRVLWTDTTATIRWVAGWALPRR